jgi:hypothetical protein
MYLENIKQANAHAVNAVASRERIYQGSREARQLGKERKGTTPLIEQQRWMASSECQMLISDNQWQMQQSIMFASLAQMELLYLNNNLITALMEEVARHG